MKRAGRPPVARLRSACGTPGWLVRIARRGHRSRDAERQGPAMASRRGWIATTDRRSGPAGDGRGTDHQPPPPVRKRRMKRSCSEGTWATGGLSMGTSDAKMSILTTRGIVAGLGPRRQRESAAESAAGDPFEAQGGDRPRECRTASRGGAGRRSPEARRRLAEPGAEDNPEVLLVAEPALLGDPGDGHLGLGQELLRPG